MEKNQSLVLSEAQLKEACKNFELACADAQELQLASNFGAAFRAAGIVGRLREVLTDDVMNSVFMPLMNTTVGFLTDKRADGKKEPYSIGIVKDCIIEAISMGLKPIGNQFNIIAGRTYPTKEGYTALLRDLNVKYIIEVGLDDEQNSKYAVIPCKINFEYNGEKSGFTYTAKVKKNEYSSSDQLRGKAERRAKKALFEHITGHDYGDADENSSHPDNESGYAQEEVAEKKIVIPEAKTVTTATTPKAAATAEDLFK